MSLFLPINSGHDVAVANCPRCKAKVQHTSLRQDPNNKNWYCPDCIDDFDPWRLPARRTENIAVTNPRKDPTDLSTDDSAYPYPPNTQIAVNS